MPIAHDRPLPCPNKHHDPIRFSREAPVARSLWKLAGTFLWVRITDKFLPSSFISNLVAILGILLLLLYHAYSQYSDRRRRALLRRRLGKIACIVEHGSSNRGFVLDSGSYFHATGDKSFLDQETLELSLLGTITVGDGSVLEVSGHGCVNLPNLTLACVLYVPGLIVNVVSVRQLMELDYQVQFIGHEFFVREICTDAVVGRGQLGSGMYQVESLKVPLDRGRCINCMLLGRLYDQS
ncbi:unnamed protein product [Urochloa humidicola]